MPINYNTSWLKGSYTNDALHFIARFENPALMASGGANLAAHFEGTSIAIGFGYDLIQNRGRAQSDLAAVGLTITNEQILWLNIADSYGPMVRSSIAILLANQVPNYRSLTPIPNSLVVFQMDRDYFKLKVRD